MKANIRGTEIFFDIAGSQFRPGKNGLVTEKPVLFLIHGGPGGNHIHFKYDSMELSQHAQLVFIDQRGSGMSKKTHPSDYTLKNNIEDIEALRQHLGLDKICILGISYGGMVAQGYAIKYAKHVEKLILVVTAPSYHFIEDAKNHLKQHGTSSQQKICDELLWPGKFKSDQEILTYCDITTPLYVYSKKQRKNRGKIIKHRNKNTTKIKPLEPDVLNVGFSTFLRKFNFIPQLKKIRCPTLILAGKHDWICHPRHSKIIAEHIKNSTLKIFPKCGHAITTDANEKYLKSVSAFLKN